MSSAALERAIASELTKNYPITAPAVHCPARISARVGISSSCWTELDGQTLKVVVTVTASHGHTALTPGSAVVSKGVAEAHLAASLDGKLKGAQVFCNGPALLVVTPGHSFGCTADTGGVQRQLVVTVLNLGGLLSYKVLPYRP